MASVIAKLLLAVVGTFFAGAAGAVTFYTIDNNVGARGGEKLPQIILALLAVALIFNGVAAFL